MVPGTFDPSALFIIAGMHPLKPYFLGLSSRRTRASPPARRSSAPPTSRSSGHRRHLTFFEMLGNFSVGEYFKQGAVE